MDSCFRRNDGLLFRVCSLALDCPDKRGNDGWETRSGERVGEVMCALGPRVGA
jgi:hypothetical protein